MAKNKQPAAIAKKWSQNLGAAQQTMTDGVTAMQASPGMKAALMAQTWIQRLQNSVERWTQAMEQLQLVDWQNAMKNKGIPRAIQAAGMQDNKSGMMRMQRFMTNFLPVMQQAAANLPAKQRGNMQNALARVQGMIQAAMDFKAQNAKAAWR